MITLFAHMYLNFQEILEDVHESLATPDNTESNAAAAAKTSTGQQCKISAQSSSFNKSNQQNQTIINNQLHSGRKSSKNAAKFDSIAALTEIMDSSSQVCVISDSYLLNF